MILYLNSTVNKDTIQYNTMKDFLKSCMLYPAVMFI